MPRHRKARRDVGQWHCSCKLSGWWPRHRGALFGPMRSEQRGGPKGCREGHALSDGPRA